LVSQTGPSGFSEFVTKEGFEDYHTWDGTGTTLVSSRTHTQSEEEDLADEGIEVEERSD
jgi:hypothetical protein